jgi:hypothetical protein
MAAPPQMPPPLRACPFCGVATEVPHESQAGCVTALQTEVGRLREILTNLRPAGARHIPRDEEDRPMAIRLTLD